MTVIRRVFETLDGKVTTLADPSLLRAETDTFDPSEKVSIAAVMKL